MYRPAAERRAQIIAAARTVFVQSSFGGARTRDIADVAGVNQATLFKHFPTKERLFEEAVLTPLLEAMQGMHGRIEDYGMAQTPAEMGQRAERSTVRHLQDMDRILPLLVTALFSDLDRGRDLFREHLEPLIRQRGEVLRPLVKEGIEPEFVGLASFGMMFAVAIQRWLGSSTTDLEATAVQFNRLATGGFARTKGTDADV
ncbi:MAG: TetR/AcrR family transcriptional regulator [Sphingobium sp.]